MTARPLSLQQQLLEVTKSNKCVSKFGVNLSQYFVQLRAKEAGDISVLQRHDVTQQQHFSKNKIKEDILQEEGRLRVIQSDLKRSNYRNSSKDAGTMDEHLRQHDKRIRRDHSELLHRNPNEAKKIKLERIVPNNEAIASFKSPSRMQLQNYEAKEDNAKPNASTY